MKKFLFATLALNLITDLISYWVLPDPAAVHFGSQGRPNGWFSSEGGFVFNLTLHGLLFALLYYSGPLLSRMPPSMVNLPNKNYWLTENTRSEFLRRWNHSMYLLASGVMLLFWGISLLILQANFAEPVRLDERSFIALMGAFAVFMLYWIISLYRQFRIPAS